MDLTTFVEGIVHEPTQTDGRGLDLTVAEIYEVDRPGRIDFGGGELDAAERTPHDSQLRTDGDDYEWWHLDSGQYLLEYNETLSPPDDLALRVQTRDALRERGAFHPSLSVQSLEAVPLSVGGAGIRIKENARVSTVTGIERL